MEALISNRMQQEKMRQIQSEHDRQRYHQEINNQAKNVWDAQMSFKQVSKNLQEVEKQSRLNDAIKDVFFYSSYNNL